MKQKRTIRKMNEKERTLVLGAMEMVDGMVGRYAGQGVAREDLQQEGYKYLCYAAMEFDENRGVLFTTFAFDYARKGMQNLVRQCRGYSSESSTEEELAQVPSPRCDEADYALMGEERRQEVAGAMGALTPSERRVIDALFGISAEAVDVQELAKRMDVGLDHIYKLKNRALRKMRGALG